MYRVVWSGFVSGWAWTSCSILVGIGVGRGWVNVSWIVGIFVVRARKQSAVMVVGVLTPVVRSCA